MSDHTHYEYADARHDHRGEYAGDRHDHDLDYAEKHHGHYDLDREDERLKALLDLLRHEVRELRNDLASALGRIRQLEQQTPQARQLQYEADLAAAGDEDDEPEWDSADSNAYQAEQEREAAQHARDMAVVDDVPVPRLRRVTCTRTVWTDGNPEPCGLPVDHDPDEKCAGNPHARPAPEASQP